MDINPNTDHNNSIIATRQQIHSCISRMKGCFLGTDAALLPSAVCRDDSSETNVIINWGECAAKAPPPDFSDPVWVVLAA